MRKKSKKSNRILKTLGDLLYVIEQPMVVRFIAKQIKTAKRNTKRYLVLNEVPKSGSNVEMVTQMQSMVAVLS